MMDDVDALIQSYIICDTMVDYANGMTTPIVKGNLAKYHNSFGLTIRYLRQLVGGWVEGVTGFSSGDLGDLTFMKTVLLDYAVELIENGGDGGTYFDLIVKAMGEELGIKDSVEGITKMRRIMTDFASIAPDRMTERTSGVLGFYIDDILNSDFYRNHLLLAE